MSQFIDASVDDTSLTSGGKKQSIKLGEKERTFVWTKEVMYYHRKTVPSPQYFVRYV